VPGHDEIKVVGLGQASLDYLGRVPLFPQEDQKSELLDLEMQCGGPASTALVTLARLGVKTSFLGSVSDDFFGREILKSLENEGVDISCLKVTPGHTSQFAFIAVSKEEGKRTVFWHRGSAPPLQRQEVNLDLFPNAQILHLDGLMIEASLEAAHKARQMNMKVVMDAGTLREGSLDVVPLVDVLIASERFAEPLVGRNALPERALKALGSLGAREVVITLGPRGSTGWDRGKILHQDVYRVDPVDTTGAGDVYHGAYIYGILQDWEMAQCMRFASAVAAMNCRHVGARKGIPNLEQVRSFMRNF